MDKKIETSENKNKPLIQQPLNDNEIRIKDLKVKIENCVHNNMITTNVDLKFFDNKEELNIWVNLSGSVRSKIAIGFPLICGVTNINKKWFAFMEKPTIPDLDSIYGLVEIPDNIKLQIIFIFQHLLQNNIFCFNPKFSLIKTRAPFSFSYFLNGVGWQVKDANYIVVLNSDSKLFIEQVDEDTYLNHMIKLFANPNTPNDITNISSYDSIAHYLVENMNQYLDSNTLNLLKIKKKTSSEINISPNQSSGSLVTFVINKVIYFGITISRPNGFNKVRIAYLTALPPSTDNTIEFDDFFIDQVYHRGNLMFRPMGYCINGTRSY